MLSKSIGFIDIEEKYDIKEIIGNGKNGEVRRCIQRSSQIEAAVKIINKSKIEDKIKLGNEIEILKMCQHPYIIKLYDVYENENNIYIGKLKLIFSNRIMQRRRPL